MDDLDPRIDALYGGPPGEFTSARAALVKELRAAGERDEAVRVHALRRPTRIAAELNRLARAEPEAVAAAIEAEDALAAAQEAVLAGAGDAGELRAAAERESHAVAALGPDRAVRAAFRLAARSSDAREDLRRGRLSQDPAPDPGAGLFGSGQVVSLPASAAPRPGAARRAPGARSGADDLAERRTRREREAAQREAADASRVEAAAARALAEAIERAERAGAERERAEARLAESRRGVADAEGALGEREEELRAALRAREQAEAAAREATARREAAEARIEH